MCEVGGIGLPGDKIVDKETDGRIVLGPGLRKETEHVLMTKPGKLCFKDPNIYWVDSHHKRYIPVRGENVLGVVTNKSGDTFKVDIGGSEQASLSYLAFEGATKRNRPDVKIGDQVFCKLLVASKHTEPEVVCIDSSGKSNGLGVIRDGGMTITTPCNHIRKILSPDCVLLKTLGNSLPYEIAIGMNGKIWIKGRTTKETIALTNAIACAEYMNNEQISLMCRKLVNSLSGF
ncbi:hypothetical protein CAPTEDRAFT_131167 [Capitella teleta]|uniref:Exosome complex component RRP40 n=1 Tax=Capitella teleta TaxID=283909 RepID=R7VC84_CAPTE|nr:hypothetical protein CAPTEDRAFT_131167 [Capitella teleta]|eukprot:ELU16219.1 hypothetical protein CAPTEDRAFT_131167 [Capitella teleta]